MFEGDEMAKNNLVRYRKTKDVKWGKTIFRGAQITKNNI